MSTALKYLAYLAAAVAAFLANVPDTVKWLVLIMALDVLTGTAIAIRSGTLSSSEAWKGGMKKVGTLIVIGLVMILDRGLNMFPGFSIAAAVTTYYIWTEALSVITNAAALGVPIPDILKNALSDLSPNKLPGRQNPGPVIAPPSDNNLPPVVDPSMPADVETVRDPRQMRGA